MSSETQGPFRDGSAKVSQRRRYRRIAFGSICAVLLAIGVWPTSYLASPRWNVWVVTDGGQPLPGIYVRLAYRNYSAEGQGHEVTLRTDENGHALFPPNYEKSCLLLRSFYTVSSALAGVHASFGRHAYVFAFGSGYEGSAVIGKYVADWRGSPESMESRIVAKRTGV
jgi:hypothetical protein